MPEYPFLIIGGGMTAAAAITGIRQHNTTAPIGVISSEPHPPYNRPPLSKGLWKGEAEKSIWRDMGKSVSLHLSTTIQKLDVAQRLAIDHNGTDYSYGTLLLATGGTPRRLPFDTEGIIYFRTLDDYRNLRALTEHGQEFVVIGGGFIGAEIAAVLTLNKKSVTMIFPEDSIGGRMYPSSLSGFLNQYYTAMDVEVIARDSITDIRKSGQQYLLRTLNGRELTADGVVAGIGIEPNTKLAREAGLKVDNGIVVDEFLRTSEPTVFAAGDVANFHNPALDTRMRVEHDDNAYLMGECAGKNMAGEQTPYHHLPFFYSDLFDIGYEAVGELDSRLETVEDWKEEFHEGVVYYLRDGRVRGVLLWNTWGQVGAARALIEEPGPFTKENLLNKIPA